MTPAARAVLDAVREDRLTAELQREYRRECAANDALGRLMRGEPTGVPEPNCGAMADSYSGTKEESMGETKVEEAVREAWAAGPVRMHEWQERVDAAIRAHERARIVAWLDNMQGTMLGRDARERIWMIMRAIETGEHEEGP